MSNEVNINVNVNVNVTAKTRASHLDRKAYDNREVKQNEVLVPMLADEELIRLLENVDRRNIRTWSMGGKRYSVIFYPVAIESANLAWKQFYAHLNEFLGERRDARCLVPQADGSYKVCPKKRGNNHVECAICPHRNEYQRENKTHFSIEEMNEIEYDPISTTDETDPIMLDMEYESLLSYFEDKPRYREIIITGFEISSKKGEFAVGNRKELVEKVSEKYNIRHSRAYQLVAETLKEVEKYFAK